jgi:hypothetical protein
MTNLIAIPLILTSFLSQMTPINLIRKGEVASSVGTVTSNSEKYDLAAHRQNTLTFKHVKGDTLIVRIWTDTDELKFGVLDEAGSLVAKRDIECEDDEYDLGLSPCAGGLTYIVPKDGQYRVVVQNPTEKAHKYELLVTFTDK